MVAPTLSVCPGCRFGFAPVMASAMVDSSGGRSDSSTSLVELRIASFANCLVRSPRPITDDAITPRFVLSSIPLGIFRQKVSTNEARDQHKNQRQALHSRSRAETPSYPLPARGGGPDRSAHRL